MFMHLLFIYLSMLLGAMTTSIALILSGRSWGSLPFYYLRVVSWLQQLYPPVYPKSQRHWPAIIDKGPKSSGLVRLKEASSAYFLKLEDDSNPNVWNITSQLMQSGLESIVQDSLSPAFDHAPSYCQSLLGWSADTEWNVIQKAAFYVCLAFRVCFLFPVRLGIFISSFVFISVACIASFITELKEIEQTWIGIVYTRLYCCGLGVVAQYKQQQNRPSRPGIAVSNHMTPNDVQILYAGVPQGSEYGYVVTGQKHTGIIGTIETLVSRLSPALWLDRQSTAERNSFLNSVLTMANSHGPILLFPEGYCTNNTQVLQFRKAVFVDAVDIHPMAIRQDGRFGDSYWFEDKFHLYLLRLMLSWAVRYDVTYLPSMNALQGESSVDFASRVQFEIARSADIPVGNIDGGLWYKKPEQARLLSLQQEMVSRTLLSVRVREAESSSEDSFCLLDDPETETQITHCNPLVKRIATNEELQTLPPLSTPANGHCDG